MKIVSFNHTFTLTKKGVTSGGSRKLHFFKNKLPLNFYLNKLFTRVTSKSGRNNTGRIVVNTKKSLSQNIKKPKINYNFRSLNLFFIGSIIIIPKLNKLFSTVVLSSGAITFLPTSTNHELFKLTRFTSILKNK
jgi:hypothetical protein